MYNTFIPLFYLFYIILYIMDSSFYYNIKLKKEMLCNKANVFIMP